MASTVCFKKRGFSEQVDVKIYSIFNTVKNSYHNAMNKPYYNVLQKDTECKFCE